MKKKRYFKGHGKPIARQQAKRARKKLNRGRGCPIGDIRNWI